MAIVDPDPDPQAPAIPCGDGQPTVSALVPSGPSLLPSQVPLPFDIRSSLRFAIPDAVPIDRPMKAVRRRLVADLRAASPNVRRAAAFDLGGWPAAPEVDRELVECLARESDLYVRSVVALSIALRNMTHDVDRSGGGRVTRSDL